MMHFRWVLKGSFSIALLLSAGLAVGLTRSLCWTFSPSAGVLPKGRQVLAKGVDQICFLRGA
jgi:hypothetical protein